MSTNNNIFTEPTYYIDFEALIPFPDTINDNISFNYRTPINVNTVYTSSGSLLAEYDNLADLITALNADQDFFEFYELEGKIAQMAANGNTLMGVRSKSQLIPYNLVSSSIYISWDSGAQATANLFVLAPNNTSSDQLLQELKKQTDLLEDIKTNTTP